ncbi:MAG: hypothetical protein R3B47_13500 [Bacteroidia bacterium]
MKPIRLIIFAFFLSIRFFRCLNAQTELNPIALSIRVSGAGDNGTYHRSRGAGV